MTTTDPTQSHGPAPAPDPRPADAAPPVQEDVLAKLTYQEIPAFKDEIRAMENVTPEELKEVIHGTVMSLVRALGVQVYTLRGWMMHVRDEDVGVMGQVIERLEEMEALVYGGDSQLTQADADLFANITAACEAFAEQSLNATQDAAGRQQLEELKALCVQGKARIDEIVMSDDDDGDDDDDDDDAAETG